MKILLSRQKILASVALRLAEIDNLRGLSGEVLQMVAPYCSSDVIVTYRLENQHYIVANSYGELSEEYRVPYLMYNVTDAARQRLLARDIFSLQDLRDMDLILPCLDDRSIIAVLAFPMIASGQIEGFMLFGSRSSDAWSEDTVEWVSTFMALIVGSVRRSIANERLATELAWRDKIYPIIAHDLRGSVGSMRMLIDALSLTDQERERVELVEMARKNATESFILLDNLLKWSRTSLHQEMELHLVTVRFLEMIDMVIAYFEPIANAKNIKLIRDFKCAEFTTKVDREMMMTVLRNLISNALKFTHQGGRVVVGVSLSEASLLLWVQDNGVGMSPEDVDRVNQRQLTAPHKGTGGESSTGFGLSLVSEFLALHGGTLSVSSTLCEGSRFSFSIAQLY